MDGSLWIGYGGGIQVYDGRMYSLIRDAELLKSLEIWALQRWDDDMWVATGNAALHRCRNGTWTWFAPYSHNGPGFYEADSLAVNSADDTLLIATAREGLWSVTRSGGSFKFDKLQAPNGSFGLLGHVRRDPLGGVYFFNATKIAHYDSVHRFVLVAETSDFGPDRLSINDVAAGSDGVLYVATDDGISVLENGQVTRHMGTFEGFGTSQGIRKVFIDAKNRLWFSTQDDVGYYTGLGSVQPDIAVVTMTPSPVPTTVPPTTAISTVVSESAAGPQSGLSLLDQILSAIAGFFPGITPAR